MKFDLANLPLQSLARTASIAIALVFAVLLGFELARLFWLLVPAPAGSEWRPRPVEVAAPAGSSPRKALNVSDLIAAKLFGDASAAPAPVATEAVDAPDTKLRLTLRGILANDAQQESRALIEPANGDLKAYAIGADVPGGATLHAIYADKVLLKRAGRLETLRLEKEKPSLGGSLVERPASTPGYSDGNTTYLDSTTAAKLAQIRTELLNDPTKASNYLRVQPASANGQLRGYRIYPGRNRELFRQAGLRPGDIVTGVNGVQLDDPTKGLQLLGDLSSAANIQLQIERGGRSQSISVTLN